MRIDGRLGRLPLFCLLLASAGPAPGQESWLRERRPADPPLDLGPPEAEPRPEGEVRGRLLLDGRPLATVARGRPQFWFRNEATNTVPTPKVSYDPGNSGFAVRGLTPGDHFVQVTLRRDGQPGMWWPGDFYGGRRFDPAAGEAVVLLWEVLHLTAPEDNAKPLPAWDSDCDPKPMHEGPVRFAWDPLGCCPDEVAFEYSVHRVDCTKGWSYGDFNEVAAGTTRATAVTLDLPPSGSQDYFMMTLVAKRAGAIVGQLQTRGAAGLGWDYRFRVGGPRPWLR